MTAARVRSATDPNNNLGFLGFTANPDSATAFGEVNTPGAGRTWFGFSSSLGTVTPTSGIVSFNLTVPPGTSISQVAAVLPGGFVGAAQSDLSGGVFDPDHTLVVAVAPVSSIPTLSEWGMLVLVSLMIFAGMFVMMRRGRRAVA